VKPENSCQGKGIYLTKKFDDIILSGSMVV
jgi:hypothetical protein